MADLESSISAIHADQVRRGEGDGLQMTVLHRGDVVIDVALGQAVPPDAPFDRRTRFPVFSCGKAVAATLAHILADRGHFSLSDPVAEVIPEFGRNGKGNIQIVHLLTHEAGIPDLDGTVPPELYTDRAAALGAIYDLEPEWPAGRAGAYHPWTAAMVLSEVVARTAGQPFEDVCQTEVLAPMGMRDTTWTRPAERRTGVTTDHPDNQPIIDLNVEGPLAEAVAPSGSMWSTAGDLARFYQTWLDEGRPPGSIDRLWSADVQKRALEPRHPLKPGSGRHYTAGFFVGHDPEDRWAFGYASQNTFGHPGWTNATALCDPDDGLVVVALSNRSLEQSRSDARLARLVDATRRALADV